MPRQLSDYLETQSPAEPILPLMHATDGYTFNLIRQNSTLAPRSCEVFNEDLLYLFYGRPGYRVAGRSLSRSDNIFSPVCFIFEPAMAINIERIYPFDTGALEAGTYEPYIDHAAMNRDTFFLGSAPDTPPKVVRAFFENNENYFLGRHNNKLSFPYGQMEVQVYYQLISANGETVPDDRRYTIELQTKDSIKLHGNLLCVILPDAALDDKNIVESLNAWNAPYRTYMTVAGFRPREYHSLVVAAVSQFLKERRLI